MWLTASYTPTTFFSLKPASATSTGGKSLVCPTPFAIKMALLDAAIRIRGPAEGRLLFPRIRQLRIALKPPRYAVVNNTFIKILKPPKNKPNVDPDLGLTIPLINTIAFREQVTFQGDMELAFQGMPINELTPVMFNINYLGKRGSFVQLQNIPEMQNWSDEELKRNGYTLLTESTTAFSINGLLQMLDDCGEDMTFEQVNIYSEGKGTTIKRGTGRKDRQLHHIVLPYRLVRSSKSYSYYERIDDERH